MLIDAIAVCAVGIIAILLPTNARYRSRLVRRTAARAGAQVSNSVRPTVEDRAARRARAIGVGILLAGLVWLVAAQLWPAGNERPTGGYVVVSLIAVFGTVGLVIVEIARPGEASDGPRWARPTTPALTDYLPVRAQAFTGLLIGAGMVGLGLTVAVSGSRWFDAQTIVRSPALFLLAAVPVLTLLSLLAARRVLDAPQPARDPAELYWQDALRADTLSSLSLLPALVSMLGLVVCGATLDDAASTAAIASGELGPTWSMWLLIGGYLLPVMLTIGALVVVVGRDGEDAKHFARRLWPAGTPVSATTGDA